MTLLEAAKRADEQISAIRRAFGPPGDYGYETSEGKTLSELYRFQIQLHAAVIIAGEDAETLLASLTKTRTNLAGLSRSDDDVFAAMVRRLDAAISLTSFRPSSQPVQGK